MSNKELPYTYIIRSDNKLSGAGNDFYIELEKPRIENNLFKLVFQGVYIPTNPTYDYPYFCEVRASFNGTGAYTYDTRTKGSSSTIGFGIVDFNSQNVYNLLPMETIINFSSAMNLHIQLYDFEGNVFFDENNASPSNVIIVFNLIPL